MVPAGDMISSKRSFLLFFDSKVGFTISNPGDTHTMSINEQRCWGQSPKRALYPFFIIIQEFQIQRKKVDILHLLHYIQKKNL